MKLTHEAENPHRLTHVTCTEKAVRDLQSCSSSLQNRSGPKDFVWLCFGGGASKPFMEQNLFLKNLKTWKTSQFTL